uniref:BED-type domain-containing protein n=1 Tax=Setaria viridis TaxID=4556 RepID=A0A4U6TY02_SETVI|nr:hypothetical protein SEVIR_7G253500v2 [Setaria viridis]
MGSRDNSGIPNRKKRSKAWKEFSITEEDAEGKPLKAECIYCHSVVRCETTKGTSVFHNHLKSENCKRKRAAIEQTPNASRQIKEKLAVAFYMEIIILMTWSIWTARNDWMFQGIDPMVQQCKRKFMSEFSILLHRARPAMVPNMSVWLYSL